MKHSWFFLFLLCVLTACHGTGTTKVSATGSIYECLVVMPDYPYEMVQAVMEADMPCLPQMEPYFTLTHVTNKAFDDFLKSTRNILIVDIDSIRYSSTKVKYSTDYWSHPQAVYRIQAPDAISFIAYWQAHGQQVREWFIEEELRRQTTFYRGSTNKQARQALRQTIGMDLLVPEDYMLIKDTTDFVWCCNNKGSMRRDLVVYSYPYTDKNTFTPAFLNRKRDEVLGHIISASVPGSYMGTEYKIFPPTFRFVQPLIKDTADSTWMGAAEVRGLWKIYHGEAMGGPYVSLTRLDERHQRIITAEVYVLAPGQKKRNALRQAEAILYTAQWAK